MSIQKRCFWRPGVLIPLILFFLLPLGLAALKSLWVLTALPVGLLFGFFLHKGDLCGASAFSEVLLLKSWKKVWGLWVAIVTAMVGFAALDLLGWVTLNPKPFVWLNYVVGGVLFGVGTVLAGGCVSGCLYKSATGNLNSLAAIPGIALGIGMVEFGLLKPVQAALKTHLVKAPQGGTLTLGSVTGLPFWALALVIFVVTVALVLWRGRRIPQENAEPQSFWLRRWKPWQAGLLIGLLGSLAYLSSAASGRNYPLGVTHGVLHARMVLTESPLVYVMEPAKPVQTQVLTAGETPVVQKPSPPARKVSVWLILMVAGLVVGAWVSAGLNGPVRLKSKPPEQVVTAFAGGCLVGIGAAIAGGCVVGNILSGWALMSLGTVLFGVVVMLSNWAATYFYLMGGTVSELLTWKK